MSHGVGTAFLQAGACCAMTERTESGGNWGAAGSGAKTNWRAGLVGFFPEDELGLDVVAASSPSGMKFWTSGAPICLEDFFSLKLAVSSLAVIEINDSVLNV